MKGLANSNPRYCVLKSIRSLMWDAGNHTFYKRDFC